MSKTVNGHITLDTYLVFGKAEVTSENHSLVNGNKANLLGNSARCYQVISILSGTKSILSTHLHLDG